MFTFYHGKVEVLKPDVGKEEQYQVILKHEPFVTLLSCGGHAQLLLGEYKGVPIAFDQHGYGYEDQYGKRMEVKRCYIGDMRMPHYFLKSNITFLELK